MAPDFALRNSLNSLKFKGIVKVPFAFLHREGAGEDRKVLLWRKFEISVLKGVGSLGLLFLYNFLDRKIIIMVYVA